MPDKRIPKWFDQTWGHPADAWDEAKEEPPHPDRVGPTKPDRDLR